MSKTIKLALKKSLIIEAVKADTYQSGQVDKAADPVKNASLAYNEQAGDEQYQERKLIRFLRSGLARFAAAMNEFVDTESGSLSYSFKDNSDNIEIDIIVSDRYNSGLAQPLASFAEEYITYTMDYMWWQSIKPALSKDYFAYAQDTLQQIRLCLAKTAPSRSAVSYTVISGTVVTTNGGGNSGGNTGGNSGGTSGGTTPDPNDPDTFSTTAIRLPDPSEQVQSPIGFLVRSSLFLKTHDDNDVTGMTVNLSKEENIDFYKSDETGLITNLTSSYSVNKEDLGQRETLLINLQAAARNTEWFVIVPHTNNLDDWSTACEIGVDTLTIHVDAE